MDFIYRSYDIPACLKSFTDAKGLSVLRVNLMFNLSTQPFKLRGHSKKKKPRQKMKTATLWQNKKEKPDNNIKKQNTRQRNKLMTYRA